MGNLGKYVSIFKWLTMNKVKKNPYKESNFTILIVYKTESTIENLTNRKEYRIKNHMFCWEAMHTTYFQKK